MHRNTQIKMWVETFFLTDVDLQLYGFLFIYYCLWQNLICYICNIAFLLMLDRNNQIYEVLLDEKAFCQSSMLCKTLHHISARQSDTLLLCYDFIFQMSLKKTLASGSCRGMPYPINMTQSLYLWKLWTPKYLSFTRLKCDFY